MCSSISDDLIMSPTPSSSSSVTAILSSVYDVFVFDYQGKLYLYMWECHSFNLNTFRWRLISHFPSSSLIHTYQSRFLTKINWTREKQNIVVLLLRSLHLPLSCYPSIMFYLDETLKKRASEREGEHIHVYVWNENDDVRRERERVNVIFLFDSLFYVRFFL